MPLPKIAPALFVPASDGAGGGTTLGVLEHNDEIALAIEHPGLEARHGLVDGRVIASFTDAEAEQLADALVQLLVDRYQARTDG